MPGRLYLIRALSFDRHSNTVLWKGERHTLAHLNGCKFLRRLFPAVAKPHTVYMVLRPRLEREFRHSHGGALGNFCTREKQKYDATIQWRWRVDDGYDEVSPTGKLAPIILCNFRIRFEVERANLHHAEYIYCGHARIGDYHSDRRQHTSPTSATTVAWRDSRQSQSVVRRQCYEAKVTWNCSGT